MDAFWKGCTWYKRNKYRSAADIMDIPEKKRETDLSKSPRSSRPDAAVNEDKKLTGLCSHCC